MHVKYAEKSSPIDLSNVVDLPSKPSEINRYTMIPSSNAPSLRRRATDVNTWANLMVKLLTDPRHPVSGITLEEVSLHCALGLPGAEDMNIENLLTRLTEWCDLIEKNTDHWLPNYHNDPATSHLTVSEFKISAMKTMLQKFLGIRYNPDVPQVGYFDNQNSRDMLIHGLLTGHGGTFVTMPTLMVAIGRQLGYPLYLVEGMEHLFVRWDDYVADERFNFDATAFGFETHDDKHFANYPKKISETHWNDHPRFLTNLTPRQEIAKQVEQRAHCLVDNLRFTEALIAYQYAHAFDPDNIFLRGNWKITIVLGKAFNDQAVQTQRKGKTHHPLRKVRLLPPQEKWEPAARKPAQEILNELKKLHGANHKVRVA